MVFFFWVGRLAFLTVVMVFEGKDPEVERQLRKRGQRTGASVNAMGKRVKAHKKLVAQILKTTCLVPLLVSRVTLRTLDTGWLWTGNHRLKGGLDCKLRTLKAIHVVSN